MGAAPIDKVTTPMMTNKELLAVQWGIQHEIHGSMEQLAEAICKGTAIAISDGSFQDQQGVAAWTIKGYNNSNQILGRGRTPSTPTDQSAYCSELFGLWGIFKALQKFSQENNIRNGRMHCL